MSVGRKLFRLWIFATAGYILLASGLMLGWVRGEFVRAAFEEYGDAHAETLVPVACSSARGQAGVDYTKQQTWDKYLYATQSDNCWYPISKFRHLFSEYNDLSDDALIEKMYQDSGTPLSEARPWMTSAQAAGIALVPPLVLLLMGSTLVWAFRRGLAEVIHACRARREPRENVDGSPHDVCLWHLADHLDGALRGQLLTQSGHLLLWGLAIRIAYGL